MESHESTDFFAYESTDSAQPSTLYEEDYGCGFVQESTPLPQKGEATLTAEAVLQDVKADAARSSAVFSLPPEYIVAGLKLYQWDIDRLNDAFFDNPEALFARLKLSHPGDATITSKQNEASVDCCHCWETVEAHQAWAVECDHYICFACISTHLRFALTKKTELFPMRCPVSKCGRLWPFDLVESFLRADQESLEKYHRFAVDSIMDSKGAVAWCTSATGGCGRVIRTLRRQDGVHHVQCAHCSSRFCFSCSDDAHGPATCKMLRDWKVKMADDSETAHWVQANTKTCPKCNKIIEKNGGCNHMTCSQCRHEFCWVCNGPWSKHGGSYYQCNSFKEEDDAAAKLKSAAKDSLQRYLFFFERFENHEKSKKLDSKVMETVTKRAKELLMSNACDIGGISFLEDTAKTLFDCRHALKYTYVYGFYLESKQRKLFEYNQSQLELATEELSFIIEGTLALDRQEVLNRVAVAKKMLTALVDGKYE